MNIAGPMVPKKVIQSVKPFLNIYGARLENHVKTLARVRVIQTEVSFGGNGFATRRARSEHEQGDREVRIEMRHPNRVSEGRCAKARRFLDRGRAKLTTSDYTATSVGANFNNSRSASNGRPTIWSRTILPSRK